MVRGIAVLVCALLVTVAGETAAQQEVTTGIVKDVDAQTGVITLQDGRTIRATTDTVILVETPATALSPGARVLALSVEPAALPRRTLGRPAPVEAGAPAAGDRGRDVEAP